MLVIEKKMNAFKRFFNMYAISYNAYIYKPLQIFVKMIFDRMRILDVRK